MIIKPPKVNPSCNDCTSQLGGACVAPSLIRVEPVDSRIRWEYGEVEKRLRHDYDLIEVLRRPGGACGPQAKYFEQRVEPEVNVPKKWWQFWV